MLASVDLLIIIRNFLVYNFTTLFVLCYLSKDIRLYLFSKVYFPSGKYLHMTNKSHKSVHFAELKHMKPADGQDRIVSLTMINTSQIIYLQRLLEVGPAEGYNFDYYPDQTSASALDHNVHFKDIFVDNLSKRKHIHLDNFHVGQMEDMKNLEDASFDVVLGTYVLCHVTDQDQCLKEVLRVLKPVSSNLQRLL